MCRKNFEPLGDNGLIQVSLRGVEFTCRVNYVDIFEHSGGGLVLCLVRSW